MSSLLTKIGLCLSLPLAANSAAGAQQVSSDTRYAEQFCGPAQLSGQYECVVSVPLSENEVRMSLTHLTKFKSSNSGQPVPSAIAAREPARQ